MRAKNILALIVLVSCFIGLSSTAIYAGITGKIAGKVTDAENNEPLPGANVLIEGTRMGAATNLEGEFIIINVPPGSYMIKVSMMGYKVQNIQDVSVSIDLTTPVNVKLQSSIIEGEEVTIVAERPLVQMDKTSSMAHVGAQQLEELPVFTVNSVLELQAGVVREGGEFHIRGGRGDEIAFWVDGVPVTNVSNYGQGIQPENYAVQELQVISGTFNAEYGQAMSGIVNIITKEGSPKYSGQIRAYVGDYMSGRDEYKVLDRVETVYNDAGAATGTIGQYTNPLSQFNPEYNVDASLSGPIPGLGNTLTFFTNARWHDYSGYLYGRDWFKSTGVPGDSSLVAMGQGENLSAQGKLTWRPSGNVKMSYNLMWSKYASPHGYSQNYRYVPSGTGQSRSRNQSHIFSLNHTLSPTTFYELRFNYLDYQSEGYVYEDPYAMPDYYVYVYSDSTDDGAYLPEMTLYPRDDEADALLFEQLKSERRQYEWYVKEDGPLGYIHPDSNAVPTNYSFANDGSGHGFSENRTQSFITKLDMSSQVTKAHLLKGGVEVRFHDLASHYFNLIAGTDPDANEELVPYTPTVPKIDSPQRSDYIRTPRELSAYVQDKMEFKDIIMNIGLRFDWFDANYVVPADPQDPDIYHPMKAEHTYRGWVKPPANLNQDEYDAYVAQFTEYTPEERKEFMHQKVDPKMQVSPRLGIAYPISDAGVIHFSYGHFFQIPQYSQMYAQPDFKINPSGGYTVFGNADLKAKRTVQYELGLQQQIGRNLGVDVTIFYRDIRDWIGTSPLVTTAIPSVQYATYENRDYANSRGITFKMERRMANNFSANVDYTFTIVEGSYSDPTDAFNAVQNKEEPRLNLIPLDWDRRHSLTGQLIWSLKTWTVSGIGRLYSGFPYTPSFPRGEVVGGTALSGLRENSSVRPNQTSVDIRVNKRFFISGLDLNLFAYVQNLFDSNDATAVYEDTGSPDYTTDITPARVSYSAQRIGTVEHYILQPGWYLAPRQVQVGLSVGF
ncbi:TonB-dependent receptor [candidate division KSB1 bacterium]|nr:MAG: TonB-dependent receptor [candidate division KSB1 bacterium]